MTKEIFLQNKKLIVAIIDDFHCIHTSQDPKDAVTSVAVHMATEIVDIVDDVRAIPVPQDTQKIHQQVQVGHQLCRGGIHLENVVKLVKDFSPKYFSNCYLAGLSEGFREFDMQRADQCVEHLR